MDKKEQIVRHLEMIQTIITRMAHNSFLLKGSSMTLLAAMLIFIVRSEASACFIFIFTIPILIFWGLDAYYLWQERLFRCVYNEVRICEKTDFDMSVSKHEDKVKWLNAVRSRLLLSLYLVEIFFLVIIFFVLRETIPSPTTAP